MYKCLCVSMLPKVMAFQQIAAVLPKRLGAHTAGEIQKRKGGASYE